MNEVFGNGELKSETSQEENSRKNNDVQRQKRNETRKRGRCQEKSVYDFLRTMLPKYDFGDKLLRRLNYRNTNV